MQNKISPSAWRVLWIAVSINFFAGLLYIWSVISKQLIVQYQWTTKEASFPYTLATVVLVISSAIFGKIQDKKGPRLTATIGGVLIGSGLILSGLTINPTIIALTFGVITGAGLGISNISTTPPPGKWFPAEKNGMVTGIVVAGLALSSAFYSPTMNYLLSVLGISRSFIIIGIFTMLLIVLLSQFLVNPPNGYVPTSSIIKDKVRITEQGNSFDHDWRFMLRSAEFYKLWLMFAFSSSAGLMIIGHTANIARIQVNWEGGFILVILLAVFNAAGRLLGGWVSDKIGRINLMRIIFCLQAINMLFFAKYLELPLLIVGVAVVGLSYGASFSVFPATIFDLYGKKHFGANYGILFTAWGVGGVIGPMIAAALLDTTGQYFGAYYLACVLLTLATLITFWTKKKNSLKDQKNI